MSARRFFGSGCAALDKCHRFEGSRSTRGGLIPSAAVCQPPVTPNRTTPPSHVPTRRGAHPGVARAAVMSALLRGATTLASISRDLATRQRPRRVAHRRVKSHASKRRVESLRCVEGVPGASVSGSSLVYARGCGASISTRAIALEDAVPVTPAEIDAEQAKAKEVRLVSAKGKAKYHPVIPRPSPAKIRRAHCVR